VTGSVVSSSSRLRCISQDLIGTGVLAHSKLGTRDGLRRARMRMSVFQGGNAQVLFRWGRPSNALCNAHRGNSRRVSDQYAREGMVTARLGSLTGRIRHCSLRLASHLRWPWVRRRPVKVRVGRAGLRCCLRRPPAMPNGRCRMNGTRRVLKIGKLGRKCSHLCSHHQRCQNIRLILLSIIN
jgi:hypothetical protein